MSPSPSPPQPSEPPSAPPPSPIAPILLQQTDGCPVLVQLAHSERLPSIEEYPASYAWYSYEADGGGGVSDFVLTFTFQKRMSGSLSVTLRGAKVAVTTIQNARRKSEIDRQVELPRNDEGDDVALALDFATEEYMEPKTTLPQNTVRMHGRGDLQEVVSVTCGSAGAPGKGKSGKGKKAAKAAKSPPPPPRPKAEEGEEALLASLASAEGSEAELTREIDLGSRLVGGEPTNPIGALVGAVGGCVAVAIALLCLKSKGVVPGSKQRKKGGKRFQRAPSADVEGAPEDDESGEEDDEDDEDEDGAAGNGTPDESASDVSSALPSVVSSAYSAKVQPKKVDGDDSASAVSSAARSAVSSAYSAKAKPKKADASSPRASSARAPVEPPRVSPNLISLPLDEGGGDKNKESDDEESVYSGHTALYSSVKV